MCVNSASTVLRGVGNNGEKMQKRQARSSRVRQGVNERRAVDALYLLEKPVYSTLSHTWPTFLCIRRIRSFDYFCFKN